MEKSQTVSWKARSERGSVTMPTGEYDRGVNTAVGRKYCEKDLPQILGNIGEKGC